MVFEKRLKSNSFTYRNIKHGIYYWKVYGLSPHLVEGMPSIARRLVLSNDLSPPKLLLLPNSTPRKGEKTYSITGRTKILATVFVNDNEVEVNEGEFSHMVDLKPGPNIIVIEVFDELGNVTYQTVSIYGDF